MELRQKSQDFYNTHVSQSDQTHTWRPFLLGNSKKFKDNFWNLVLCLYLALTTLKSTMKIILYGIIIQPESFLTQLLLVVICSEPKKILRLSNRNNMPSHGGTKGLWVTTQRAHLSSSSFIIIIRDWVSSFFLGPTGMTLRTDPYLFYDNFFLISFLLVFLGKRT